MCYDAFRVSVSVHVGLLRAQSAMFSRATSEDGVKQLAVARSTRKTD